MKKAVNYALLPILMIFLSFSFYSLNENYLLNNSDSGPKRSSAQNDSFKITALYAKGMVPYPAGVPDTIQAVVSSDIPNPEDKRVILLVYNNGTVLCDPLTNLDDSCFDGTPKILDEIIIENDNAFDSVVNFEIDNSGIKENDLIIVSAVKGEGTINGQTDFLKYCYKVTKDGWNHADSCKTKTKGTVFSGRPGNIVAGFRNQGPSNVLVTSVQHTFFDTIGSGFKPYKVVVYSGNGAGKPDSLMHISPLLTSPAGTNSPQTVSYNLSSPVSILPGKKFFVGLRQTTSSNIRAAFQTEVPVRSNAFFFTAPDTGNIWYDFSDSSKNLVIDISPKIQYDQLNINSLVEGFYNEITNQMVRDTMRVYIRSSSSPFLLIDSAKKYIHANGFAGFNFSNVNNGVPYYLQLKHRNSISTWSKSPLIFTSGNLTYNFTTSGSQAYGNNMKLKGTKYCIYSGDVTGEGSVDLSDLIVIQNSANSFSTGYIISDLNGDNLADLSDVLICYNNSSAFVSSIAP